MPPSAAGTPTATAEPAFSGTLGPVEKPAPPAPPVQALTDVQVGRHAGYDRIVFKFSDGLPGYRIGYVQPPIVQDGSGAPVTLRGNAFLQVLFMPASGYDIDAGRRVYTGPLDLQPGFPSLVEATQTGDFEAVLTWTLGVQERRGFRVLELRNPWRVAIDVGHQE